MKLTCLIIDDEPLARKGMEKFVQRTPDLELFESCDSAQTALDILEQNPIDILFLDIHMPGMTGLALLEKLNPKPATIITTAYPNYALKGFELDVMDYLVKPIPFERFEKAVAKTKEFLFLKKLKQEKPNASHTYFFIKCEGRYEKIFYDDLLYVEALQNYVVIYTDIKKYISYLTLKSVEEYLPSDKFLKVQKSNIVSIEKIENIEGRIIKIQDRQIRISKKNKEEVVQRILGNNLLRR